MSQSLQTFTAAVAHAAPVFLDRDATLDKMCDIVDEASRAAVALLVFPESYVPGFPLWALVHAPIDTHGFFRRLCENAVDVPGPATERIGALARGHGMFISVGVTERSPISVGTLYNTNLLFDPDGTLINRRRKIMPTWAEKLVWAQGDAAELRPVSTVLGSIGVLICGENTNPLARYALAAQGEQIHLSTYPPAWPFHRDTAPDYAQWVRIRSVAHSFEAKVFNLTAAGHLDERTITQVAAGDPRTEATLRDAPSAMSLIVGPGGELIGDPLRGREGLLIASIDLGELIIPRVAHDIAGHYQRHDLFSLTLDQRPRPPIRFLAGE
ncbi:MAG TPA: carbon-nitrogen hydrolase family protein [Sporichthyaceae bacterium]|nr:carbon-nitrogen hydrolase family protein [Sporichthyaceae bacterium]